jgi:hypothetical protein
MVAKLLCAVGEPQPAQGKLAQRPPVIHVRRSRGAAKSLACPFLIDIGRHGRVLVAAFPRPLCPKSNLQLRWDAKVPEISRLSSFRGPQAMEFRRGGNSTAAPAGVMDSGLAGKSEKPTCQHPGMTPRGACCGLAKMQHCDGFAAVQLSNPAAARTIALSLCAPCAVTQRQAPVARLNQAGAFSLPPPPTHSAADASVGAGLKPSLQMVSGSVGASRGPQKTQHVFWDAPHCLALFPHSLSGAHPGDAMRRPDEGSQA